MDYMEKWTRVAYPPETALKKISGGRLSGMTDINPQWRYYAMTDAYGLCGSGWKYEIVKKWTEQQPDGQVLCFVDINLYIKIDDQWLDPIPGSGGSLMVAKESGGLRSSDECYKMATTDALSVAMKMIGVGSSVYEGRHDTKYSNDRQNTDAPKIDFNDLRLDLIKIKTVDMLINHHKNTMASSVLSEKQKAAVNKIYTERRVEIEADNEHIRC